MEREQRWYWPDTLTLCFLLPPGGTATVVVEIARAEHSTEHRKHKAQKAQPGLRKSDYRA